MTMGAVLACSGVGVNRSANANCCAGGAPGWFSATSRVGLTLSFVEWLRPIARSRLSAADGSTGGGTAAANPGGDMMATGPVVIEWLSLCFGSSVSERFALDFDASVLAPNPLDDGLAGEGRLPVIT